MVAGACVSMRVLAFLKCCGAQQDEEIPEELYGEEGVEKWESLQERKERLKNLTSQDLREELEALGVKVCEDGGRKKCKSEKKLRREYRKLLMREMRTIDLENSKKTLAVKNKRRRRRDRRKWMWW